MNTLTAENPVIDTEYIILENIYDSSGQDTPLRQRDLAQTAGASLGMTNSILKRLAQKGWISAKKINSRNIHYAVTLDGMNEIIHRSYRYFKRTIRNVVYFKDILEDLIDRAKKANINTVILVGTSDLDFIIEHLCGQWEINLRRVPENENTALLPNTLNIYAEGILEKSHQNARSVKQNEFYLSRLIIRQAATANNGEYPV